MDENLVESLEALNRSNLELLSSYSPAALIGGVLFSIIGIYFFRFGKKNANNKVMVAGMALIAYPLFVTDTALTWALGGVLTGFAYYWRSE